MEQHSDRISSLPLSMSFLGGCRRRWGLRVTVGYRGLLI